MMLKVSSTNRRWDCEIATYLESTDPGPNHKFRFIYDGNVSNFLVVAHPLQGARPFTKSICRLEDILPGLGESQDPSAFAIGKKTAVSEYAFRATFDVSSLCMKHPGVTGFEGYTFLISIFRSQPSQSRLSTIDYILLDNYIVASVDFVDRESNTVQKKANIIRLPVVDESLLEWNDQTWPPSIVPPLIKNLEKLARDGKTPIQLPAKRVSTIQLQSFEDLFKARLSLNERLRDRRISDGLVGTGSATTPDRVVELPPAKYLSPPPAAHNTTVASRGPSSSLRRIVRGGSRASGSASSTNTNSMVSPAIATYSSERTVPPLQAFPVPGHGTHTDAYTTPPAPVRRPRTSPVSINSTPFTLAANTTVTVTPGGCPMDSLVASLESAEDTEEELAHTVIPEEIREMADSELHEMGSSFDHLDADLDPACEADHDMLELEPAVAYSSVTAFAHHHHPQKRPRKHA